MKFKEQINLCVPSGLQIHIYLCAHASTSRVNKFSKKLMHHLQILKARQNASPILKIHNSKVICKLHCHLVLTVRCM